MAGLLLTDLIDVELLQKIQDEFSKYTGMAALTTDADGNPLTEGSAFTDFCMKYTRQSELGYKRCVASDKNAAVMALESGEPVVYVCHAGLADFASPIMLGDRLLGCFLGGQVRISSKIDEEALKETAEELGIRYESYYEAMENTNVIGKKELKKSAKFLGIVANVLSEMAYQNYMAIDKYRNLERAARSQSHFLMDLSSDLHENMSEWISALQDVVKNGSVDSVMNVIDTMLTNGANTYSIIGDIVDYMKFSDGNVALYETAYSIYDVVQAVVELEEEEARQKGIRLSYEISDTVPSMLFGDGGRIGQLLTKLIANAIAVKENADTPSELRISVSTRKDSYAQILKITVQNLGEVLKPEELDSIHEYFSRGILRLQEREDVNEFALSIVDLFVRQMQGRITADSNEAEGTTFVIELPQLEVTES
ncbi:MAG: PocR ligand-binding domain-containing protein [Lachnospiraceae bacterium]|nr:PocR ligand-binding domain-containing protein [Lachnospiraceae bacterium]